MKKIILTGDRPTGKLHLGHYVGSLKQRVEMQNSNKYDEIYIEIADTQALTDNFDNVDKVRNNIIEVAKDYLACGIDPNKSTIFIQSMVPQLNELTTYYMNLISVNRLKQIPTIKEEIGLRAFNNSVPMGFLNYPVSQAADITAFEATDVPVGDDNVPLIEITRDIVKRFNNLYSNVLVMPNAVVSSSKSSQRLVGTDGMNKMSKSLSNAIFLADSNEEIERKVLSMYTDPNHININDKGNTTDNPVFIYLDIFSEERHYKDYFKDKDIKYNNLKELKSHYENGGLGDMVVKRFLSYVLIDVITPIREKRESLNDEQVLRILYESSMKAREKAKITLKKVKRAMEIDYFNN